MAYHERWSPIPIRIREYSGSTLLHEKHTTLGRFADPMGGKTQQVRDQISNGETAMLNWRGIISIIDLCPECES